jgi:branched-chain amino acid transport system ATP-binding protein
MTSDVQRTAPALKVEGLDAFYGKSQVAFKLDLNIEHGETVAILGRNGAGKTSIVMAIAGVISARQKALALDGENVDRLPAHKRVRAGLMLVPSGSRAFPDLTVEENLGLLKGRSHGGRAWSTREVYEAFPKLNAVKKSKGNQLSGGERQMLAVARAMVAGPKVLMLDEPSEGLAPLVLREIGAILEELAKEGLSVLLTEQNYRFALGTAQRVYFIEKGHAVWTGSAEEASVESVIGRYLGV